MSANKYLSYVYLIGWSKLDLWYYGVRYAQVKRRQDYDLWIDYFTHSGPVKHMRAFVGEPDIIHYDKIFDSIDEARKYELKVLVEHNCKNSIHWLNKNDVPAPPFMNGNRNGMYGRKHTKEAKEKQQKEIEIDNIIYNGVNEAAFILGVHRTTITKWIKFGKPTKEKTREKISNSLKGKPSPARKSIIIDGVNYNSSTEAAKILKVNRTTVNRWRKNGKPTREETYKRRSKSHEGKNTKKVIIKNKIFNSIIEASNYYDVNPKTVTNWVKKGKAKFVL